MFIERDANQLFDKLNKELSTEIDHQLFEDPKKFRFVSSFLQSIGHFFFNTRFNIRSLNAVINVLGTRWDSKRGSDYGNDHLDVPASSMQVLENVNALSCMLIITAFLLESSNIEAHGTKGNSP